MYIISPYVKVLEFTNELSYAFSYSNDKSI